MATSPPQTNGSSGYKDKDFDVERQVSQNEMQRNQLTNTVTLSSEVFENLYLSPKNQFPNDLRKKFANPTPIAIMGFVVGLTPLSCEFMAWRGSGGFGVATTTASIFFGGILLILAGIGEFFLGNTFPFVVFMGYGAHFLTYSTTFIPFFHAIAFFNPEAPPGQDAITPTFAASYGESSTRTISPDERTTDPMQHSTRSASESSPSSSSSAPSARTSSSSSSSSARRSASALQQQRSGSWLRAQ